ncbi:Protein of unknown function [Gryllus bimaculatus]|nr:Protein of unknown function [Gryllus bimaculatus]
MGPRTARLLVYVRRRGNKNSRQIASTNLAGCTSMVTSFIASPVHKIKRFSQGDGEGKERFVLAKGLGDKAGKAVAYQEDVFFEFLKDHLPLIKTGAREPKLELRQGCAFLSLKSGLATQGDDKMGTERSLCKRDVKLPVKEMCLAWKSLAQFMVQWPCERRVGAASEAHVRKRRRVRMLRPEQPSTSRAGNGRARVKIRGTVGVTEAWRRDRG